MWKIQFTSDTLNLLDICYYYMTTVIPVADWLIPGHMTRYKKCYSLLKSIIQHWKALFTSEKHYSPAHVNNVFPAIWLVVRYYPVANHNEASMLGVLTGFSAKYYCRKYLEITYKCNWLPQHGYWHSQYDRLYISLGTLCWFRLVSSIKLGPPTPYFEIHIHTKFRG
jgi:hypothetical protein